MVVIRSEVQLISIFNSLLKEDRNVKMVFEGQRHTKMICISGRKVLYAMSNLLRDKLSEILFKGGKLTQDQYMLSTELSIVTKKIIGEIMISEGFVTKEEVEEGLRYQAEQIIGSLFEYPDWKLKIKDFTPDRPLETTPKLPLIDALVSGIRKVDNLSVLYEAIPKKDGVLEIVAEREALMKKIRFSRDESLLVLLIDGKRTVQEILEESKLLEYRFYKTIYPFLVLKLFRVTRKPEAVKVKAGISAPTSTPSPTGDSGKSSECPSVPASGSPDTQSIFKEAQFLIAHEEYSAAATRLKKLIRLDNKKAAYFYYLGLALDHIPGQNKEAEQILKTAIRLENYNPRYYLALGYLYLNRNMKRQAKEQFMIAKKWDPDDPYVNEALEQLEQLSKKGVGFLTAKLFGK